MGLAYTAFAAQLLTTRLRRVFACSAGGSRKEEGGACEVSVPRGDRASTRFRQNRTRFQYGRAGNP